MKNGLQPIFTLVYFVPGLCAMALRMDRHHTSFGCFAVATAVFGALAVLILGAVFGLPAILRKLGAVESAAKCREAAVAGIVAPAVITIFWSLLFLPIDGPRCP